MQIYDIIGNSYGSALQRATQAEEQVMSERKGLLQPRMNKQGGTKQEADRIAEYVKMIRAKRKMLNG